MPTKRIADLAVACAELSNHRFRLGAVIHHGSRVLGVGFNQADKTHPASPHPFKSIHAEFSAFVNATRNVGIDRLKGSSIYVHRLKADGGPGLAKPCRFCEELLNKVGVRNISWSMSV